MADTEPNPEADTTLPRAPKAPTGDWRKELVAYRGWLYDLDYKTSNEYDKLLSALAAGALSVSVGLFKDQSGPWWLSLLLLVCWLLFAATLLIALLAFLPTREMLAIELANTDERLAGREPSDEQQARRSATQRRARAFNRAALGLFVGGVALQFVVVTVIQIGGFRMSDERRTSEAPFKRSYDVAPKAPPQPTPQQQVSILPVRESYDVAPSPPPPPPPAPSDGGAGRGRASYDLAPSPPPPPPDQE